MLTPKKVDWYTDAELITVAPGSVFTFDSEVYKNYFCIAFRNTESKKVVAFERSQYSQINIEKLNWMLWRFCLVSFNGNGYDMPILTLLLKGQSNEQLKDASNEIINNQMRAYQTEKHFKIKVPNYNHIDLIEVAPLTGSLKKYAARLHCERLQELPYPHDSILDQQQMLNVLLYCANDLELTELLLNELQRHIDLRKDMSKQYGVDLRSKSDAQIAETVIISELQKLKGSYYIPRPKFSDELLRFQVPNFIQFQTPVLQKLLEQMTGAKFGIDKGGKPQAPPEIEGKTLVVGKTVYKVGMGGLHSQESSQAHFATDDIIIADNDVESFYPRVIINQKLFPEHLTDNFLYVYESIVVKRLQAKIDKNKLVADILKIVVNGSFGKFGDIFSKLYSPQLLLQVTITGQLVLLMLIEFLELNGIEVISGNTDGIVSKYHKNQHEQVRNIIKSWENYTGFTMEETQYKALLCRDVNNYIAFKTNGEIKRKGFYSENGSALNSPLSKNPEHLICSEAIINYISKKIPIEKTIYDCQDVSKFLSIREVKGGGIKNGQLLGKVVRWYYAKNEKGVIVYKDSGNQVPKTEGAKPLIELPTSGLPEDLDYAWYTNTAKEMLYGIGVYKRAKSLSLF